MMFDKENLVSDSQDLAQTAAAYLSTYSIDLGAAGTIPGAGGGTVRRDPAKGNHPHFLIQVDESFDSSGDNTTLKVEVVSAADAALTDTLTVHVTSATLAQATVVAGYKLKLDVPYGITQRYLGLRYTIGTATSTAGKVTAGYVMDVQDTY